MSQSGIDPIALRKGVGVEGTFIAAKKKKKNKKMK
jgi:hypothetical protein